MGSIQTGPKFLIIKNFDSDSLWGTEMITSFSNLLLKAAPHAVVDVVNAITDAKLPDPSAYEVIVLTGGVYNLTLEKVDTWVARELEYIQSLNKKSPHTKVIGICWGHQAVCRALGGSIAFVDNNYMVGLKTETTNAAGKCFFGADSLDLLHFRVRKIKEAPAESIALAEDNTILYYPSRNILTFQGHPEFTSIISHDILDTDGGAFTGQMDQQEQASTRASFDQKHDGEKTFAQIMDWALNKRGVTTAV